MRFFILLAFLAFLPTQSFSQEKDKKDRPRLFKGGLIKRFEDLQEKLQKDREERKKEKDEERDRDERLREDRRRTELERLRAEIERRLDPYAPKRTPDPNPANRAPDTTKRSLTDTQAITDAPKVNLGVEVRPTGITTSGLIIEKVIRRGPAEKAGLRVDDRITAVGGSPIKKMDDLILIMSAFEPGDRTEIEVVRKGKKETVLVDFPSASGKQPLALNSARGTIDDRGDLGDRRTPADRNAPEELPLPGGQSSSRRNQGGTGLPPVLPKIDDTINKPTNSASIKSGQMRAGIGVTAVGVDPGLFARKNLSVRQGAFLEVISKDSAAEKAGLKPGDVVIALDGRKIDSAVSMAELVQTYKPGDKAQLLYYRDNRLKRTEIEMDAVPASQFDQLAQSLDSNAPGSDRPDRISQNPKRNSFLSELGEDFPRLKKVEDLIDRFSVSPKNGDKARSTDNRPREAELENEVQSLRNRLRGQDQQIKDLTEKLSLIEKLLSERKAENKSPEKK